MTHVWRLGIIGLGWAGAQHARAARALAERVTLAAVADVDEGLARRAAEEWGAPHWTTEAEALLARDDLDAVSVCLPHNLHAPVSIAAAQRGLHVLVEKPLASSLAEADAMLAAAEAAGVKLMVAENTRFDAVFNKAAELVTAGAVGRPFMVRIAREHYMREYLEKRPWFLTDPDAGIMVSGGIHDFELLRMLGGEIEHVYALQGVPVLEDMQADDSAVALAGLRNGAAAVLVESFSLRTARPGVSGSVHGSEGSLWFDGAGLRLYAAEQDEQAEAEKVINVPEADTFVLELGHFLDCLDDPAREPVTSGREQRKPLVAVRAAYESMRTGRRVVLAEFDKAGAR